MLVDSHCHLDFPDFEDEVDAVVARARANDVTHMVTICTQMRAFQAVRAVAERFDNIYCSVGIHPHEVANEPDIGAAELVEAAEHAKVIGIGETGLDYHYDSSPRDLQRELFRRHIQAARTTGLPVIVHSREAEEDTADILREEMGVGPFSGVMHCFSSRRELAEAALDLGLFISLSGILTFKNAGDLRDIALTVPLERLLVETDAPYLAPVPKRGKRNEPAFVAHTAAKLAELRGLSTEELGKVTTDNFFRLFSKAKRIQ